MNEGEGEATAQGSWLPEQRRQEIGRRIHAYGRVSVREMARVLGVSQETVRRDLETLAERGIVERTHGGAVSPAWAAERTFAEQVRLHAAAKARMADACFEAIAGARRVVLDAGSSCAALAARLRELSDLEVVTNNVPAATTLSAAPGVRVLLVGGRLRQPTLSLVGDWATERLIAYRAEVAVLGTNGLNAQHGLFTPTPEEAAVKRAMARAAAEVWVLADASKFAARPEGHVFAQWGDVHHLVTESQAPAREVAAIEAQGVRVHLV
ncbi:MAG: DeoR/GlpR family DNA-binding transcription regulator [Firmicutes bacterium]|nr:DeoR/GlpR family DNA-binding transcription regulator [Bacillota bacterium]